MKKKKKKKKKKEERNLPAPPYPKPGRYGDFNPDSE
jgi:hypothetical protein